PGCSDLSHTPTQPTGTIGASSLPFSSGLLVDIKSHFVGLSAFKVPRSTSACTFDLTTPTNPALTSLASTSVMSHRYRFKRYLPGVRTLNCGPRWPPFDRNTSASSIWNPNFAGN